MEIFLSIDPGREKCGIAVIKRDKTILYRKIVPTSGLNEEVSSCLKQFKPGIILMGNATWSKRLKPRILKVGKGIPLEMVDEKHSTERAKLRYYEENPPRGLWKLIPVTLQVPKEPYDDYAAIILAEDYIEKLPATGKSGQMS